jgi:hypothetical protein
MRTKSNAINAPQIKDEIRNWYAFEEPLGEVVHNTRYFFAWKDGFLVGSYNSLEEAMESLACLPVASQSPVHAVHYSIQNRMIRSGWKVDYVVQELRNPKGIQAS